MPEKRQHPRRVVQIGVAYQAGSGPRLTAACYDISLGGMFIETPEPYEFGAELVVFLQLPGLSEEAKVKSTVRWKEPTGMGVQFGTMGARETYALTKLLSTTGKA